MHHGVVVTIPKVMKTYLNQNHSFAEFALNELSDGKSYLQMKAGPTL